MTDYLAGLEDGYADLYQENEQLKSKLEDERAKVKELQEILEPLAKIRASFASKEDAEQHAETTFRYANHLHIELRYERVKTARLEAKNEKLEAQNAKLKEALRPFAEAWEEAQADGHKFPHGYHDDFAYKNAYDVLKEVCGD